MPGDALAAVGLAPDAVGGGGVRRVTLPDGRAAVVKRDPSVPAEAAGLRWLAVRGGPPVPQVYAADAEWLVSQAVPAGSASASAAEDFGRRLAALHETGAAAFGAPPPGGPADAWIGTTGMRNEPGDSWPEWYAEHRVLAYVRRAGLPDTAVFDEVCARLPQLAGPAEPPARLHGDLWSGNVLWSTDGTWLIDPAAHGGHRETDLAMLALFGLPHLDRVLAAYDEASPLAAGWRARVPLHQLFPLLVHTVLFGGGYASRAMAAALAALRAA
ncbi:fructosamine kinase family protein [Pseudonocardia kujensis]|uniref:fructosamine kinase family protein n=1 Tax=Pseudonocardia kujensis TaxID=1128675 RepID=UPI003557CA08